MRLAVEPWERRDEAYQSRRSEEPVGADAEGRERPAQRRFDRISGRLHDLRVLYDDHARAPVPFH